MHGRRSHGNEAFISGRRTADETVLYGRIVCQVAALFVPGGGPSCSLRRTNGRTKRSTNGRLTWQLTAAPAADTVAPSVAITRLRRSMAFEAFAVLCGMSPALSGHPIGIRRTPKAFRAARSPANNCSPGRDDLRNGGSGFGLSTPFAWLDSPSRLRFNRRGFRPSGRSFDAIGMVCPRQRPGFRALG